MNAQITSPNSTIKTPAPAVITSGAAQSDLLNKQTQVGQLNTDTANHQALVSGQLPPAPTGTDASKTTTPASNTPSNTDTAGSLDDQVNSILSSFGNDSSKINSDASAQEKTLGDEASQAQADLDSAAVTSLSQLKQIASGVYPLSPAESSLLNATASGFQQAIQYQTQANASYTGQMTEAMASLGISTSAPTEAIGLIHAAISSGTSKITDLNSQMATSLANLQLGFQKQDYQMVQDSWDETSKYMEDRVSTFTAMQKQVTDAAHQQVQDLQAATQMNLTTIMDSAKFTYQQKQDAITNALSQGTLDEKTANDLRTYSLNVQKENFAESGGTGGTIAGLPTVAVSSLGTANTAQQAAFLAQLSPAIATQVQGIANYSIDPKTYPTRLTSGGTGLTEQQAVALAKQYDPSYDQNQYATRAATMKQFQSGTYSQNVTALNTAIGHLTDLAKAKAGLGNTSVTPFNAIKNATESALGNGNITKFSTTLAAATGELASAFKKSGATDQEISSLGTIDANSSPAQIQAYVTAASGLLGSRLDALNDTYSSSMGSAPPGGTFLSSASQSALLNLQNQGYDMSNVSSLQQTPVARLANFQASSATNSTMLKQLESAMPDATPDEIVDYLQTNGAM